MTITPALLDAILTQYALPLYGVHGIAHWARVLENGRRLAAVHPARLPVVELPEAGHWWMLEDPAAAAAALDAFWASVEG